MSPTPDPENVHGIINWLPEVIAGTIVLLFTWWAKLKGKRRAGENSFATTKDMKICQQEIIIQMEKRFDEHEEKIITRLKEIIGK